MATDERLIAVISRDGIGINERLHRATDVFVFSRAGDTVRFVERRPLPAPVGRVFRDYLSLAQAVAGCRTIVALGFSGEARRELAARGFLLHEARGPIDGVVRSLPAGSFGPPC
jgi:hypothetical protein